MTRMISVRPGPSGWAVQIDDANGALAFRAGGQAEAAARKLAQRFADMGEGAEIQIYLRDGALAGRFYAPPAQALEPVAA